MAEYTFLSVWTVAAPIRPVWEIISAADDYPSWFPYVLDAMVLSERSPDGAGGAVRSTWSSALPYGFTFDTETVRVVEPVLLEVRASGELEGNGRWRLIEEDPETTTIHYEWTVRTAKPWMRLLAPILSPAFAWNHAVLMRAGGTGLADKLGVPLLVNRSFTHEGTSPLPALLSLSGVLFLLLLATRFVRFLVQPARYDAVNGD